MLTFFLPPHGHAYTCIRHVSAVFSSIPYLYHRCKPLPHSPPPVPYSPPRGLFPATLGSCPLVAVGARENGFEGPLPATLGTTLGE